MKFNVTQSLILRALPAAKLAAIFSCLALAALARAEDPIWFEDLIRKPAAAPGAAEAIAARFADLLISGKSAAEAAAPPAEAAPAPRIFFLSLADGKSPARVVTAAGLGWPAALADAEARAKEAMTGGFAPLLVKADVVGEVIPEKIKFKTRFIYTREFYGLAFEPETRAALLPEELVAGGIFDEAEILNPAALQNHLKRRKPAFPKGTRFGLKAGGSVWRFRLESACAGAGGPGPVYRGHRTFASVEPEMLLASARAGGEYLARMTGPEGRFIYSYDPAENREASTYNILRHAGTAYSMFELYRVTRDAELLRAAERAIAELKAHLQPWDYLGGKGQVIVEGGRIKLGGTALAIIAMAEHAEATGDLSNLRLMQNLALWMISVQRPSGEFAVHHQSFPKGDVIPEVSEYYPGEAILALIRLHKLDPLRGWSEYAHNGARWLIEERDAGISEDKLPHDHWLLIGLNELYRERKNPIYLEHARKLTRAIEAAQLTGARFPDWNGGFGEPPRSTPAATRAEGLLAAYALERDFGEAARAEAILGMIRRSAAFQLQLQYRLENSMHFPAPARALGGFRESHSDPRIRIDFVQHNISSLLGLRAALMRAAEGKSNPG